MLTRFSVAVFGIALLLVGLPGVGHAQSARFRIGVGVDTSPVVNHSGGGGDVYLFDNSDASFRFGLSYDIYRPATQPLTGLIYWDTNVSLAETITGIGFALRTHDRTRADALYAGVGLGLYGPIGGAGGKLLLGYETRSHFFVEANLTLLGDSSDYTPRPAFVVGVGF